MNNRWLIPLLAIAAALALAYGAFSLGYWPTDLWPVMAAPREDVSQAATTISPAQRIRAEARVVPERSVELSMAIEGIVQEVFVREGDPVTAGQLLVKLKDNRQRVLIAQAQAALNRARAALDLIEVGFTEAEIGQAEAALAAAEANYAKLADGLTPGAIAAAEATLAQAQADYSVITSGADPQEIIEAAANLELAQAQLNQATSAYNKVKGSPEVGMTLEALEMQEATAAYNAAQARYDLLQAGTSSELAASAAAAIRVAQAQLDALKQSQPGELAEADALVKQAQAALDFFITSPRPEEVAVAQGDVDIAVALLQDALVALSETELRAPFDGVITALDIDSGEPVAPSVPVLQLADLSHWRVETLDLSEIDVAAIAPGAPVDISFDALPSLVLTGTVSYVRPVGENSNAALSSPVLSTVDAPLLDQLRGDIVYRVVVEPEMHDERLLWNMTALVDFGPRP